MSFARTLENFFSEYGTAIGAAKPRAFSDQLNELFTALQECAFDIKSVDPIRPPAPQLLSAFFSLIQTPIQQLNASGAMANPWQTAGLKHDEVRNAAVLAWFLDPRQTHGCDNLLLSELLGFIRRSDTRFPTMPNRYCRVVTESLPDGDRGNRVDIEIDDPEFLLIIEVKINAGEGMNQIERYKHAAQTKSANRRPWIILFLTPSGMCATTCTNHDNVIPIRWKDMSIMLRSISKNIKPLPRFMATTFAKHIENF